MSTCERQEGNSAVEVDGETTLDLIEDDAIDALAIGELLLELDPAFFTACFFARPDSSPRAFSMRST